MNKYTPKRINKIWICVRQSDEKTPSYAPRSSEVRSKKFYSEDEARKLAFTGNYKLYYAEVSEWVESCDHEYRYNGTNGYCDKCKSTF